MNRTKIEWCSHTWNPVTGCWGPGGTAETPRRCLYCYAWKVAQRFWPNFIKEGEKGPIKPFSPRFWPDRLSQPAKVKKPSRIFVCSMGDLFGAWVPMDWINDVLWAAEASPQHTFIFLTKNPKAYVGLGAFPRNCWVGATITNQADADERIPALLKAQAAVRFVSVEPMLGPVDLESKKYRKRWNAYLVGWEMSWWLNDLTWLIIGAMTGPGSKAHQPDPAWVQSLIDQGRDADVPVFLKDNLKWPEKLQEWPA